jgi:hypothetical protein
MVTVGPVLAPRVLLHHEKPLSSTSKRAKVELRGCLKSLGRRESTQHQTRHREVNHGLTALGQPFIVFAQAT